MVLQDFANLKNWEEVAKESTQVKKPRFRRQD
jgi:hypothetical protein